MIERAEEELKVFSKEMRYCGFVWFVIPKIIINLKITSRESDKNGVSQFFNDESDQEKANSSDEDF